MITITKNMVYEALRNCLGSLACELSQDVASALKKARNEETCMLSRCALNQLCINQSIAASERVPICQDTGTVWVCLEIGEDVSVLGDVFSRVDEAVAQSYKEAHLRRSVVCDALVDRVNTQTNAPAFTEITMTGQRGVAKLHVMLKGGGSDNASRVTMLTPGAGKRGIIDEVLDCVRKKGANACPPLVIGIGIGATFDKVAGLAKHALMRKLGEPSKDVRVAAFERELLEAVNQSGVGAAGLGGSHTALAVHVQTAPCHIAALPLAINMGCSAHRRCTIDLCANEILADSKASSDNASDVREDIDFDVNAVRIEGRHISLPLSRKQARTLKAGEICLLSGDVFTLRDAGHMRLLEQLAEQQSLPYGLDGQIIFYAGPTPPAAGRPFGAIGPTTASRMDFATPQLLCAGVVATIGKGPRSETVRQACMQTGSVYFAAVGGAAAFLAKCIDSSQTLGYDDLGTEALRRVRVTDFPVFVAIDTQGNDIYNNSYRDKSSQ